MVKISANYDTMIVAISFAFFVSKSCNIEVAVIELLVIDI